MEISHTIKMTLQTQLRQLTAALMLGGVLAGCEANAKVEKKKVPVREPSKTVTLEDCTAKTDQKKMIACFEALSRQQEIERLEMEARTEELKQDADAARKRLEGRILEPERD